jgi:hypothetical protein
MYDKISKDIILCSNTSTTTCVNVHMYTGFGSLLYPNGKKYQGDIKCGKRHGNGSMTLPNRITYHGLWINDVRHGIHHVTFPTPKDVQEKWNHGVREWTMIRYNNGSMYKGDCKEKSIIPHGNGSMTYPDGTLYHGSFYNGSCQGNGSITYKNGNSFHGLWNHNKEEGEGQFYFKNGFILKGKWNKGKRMSKATIVSPQNDSMTLSSDWTEERDGFIYEYGTIEFSSGKTYTGNIRDGLPHGKGTMVYFHGDVVTTMWNNGRIVHSSTLIKNC